jgi:FkbM family methyltransferase
MIKRWLVATTAGPLALRLREKLELWRAVERHPELAASLLNDQCAARLLPRLAQSRSAFLDVGAHIGSVLAAVRAHDPSVALLAIEAIPEKALHLERRFPGVRVHQVAAGERAGEVTFYVDDERSGYSSLAPYARGSRRAITVPMARLDDLFPTEPIDVVKIDVEGAELGVLRGGEALVARTRPTFLFESGPEVPGGLGYTKEALWEWFDAHGYDVLVPNRLAHDGPGLGREGFLESHFWPRRTTNYFAVARERRLELRDRARVFVGVVPRG